jgi:hypothetical protein
VKRLMLLTVLGCMFALFVSNAAQAATTHPPQDPDPPLKSRVAAPSCVSARVERPAVGLNKVYGFNNCSGVQRIKVIIAFGPDSACKVLSRGDYYQHRFTKVSRFDGLVRC